MQYVKYTKGFHFFHQKNQNFGQGDEITIHSAKILVTSVMTPTPFLCIRISISIFQCNAVVPLLVVHALKMESISLMLTVVESLNLEDTSIDCRHFHFPVDEKGVRNDSFMKWSNLHCLFQIIQLSFISN